VVLVVAGLLAGGCGKIAVQAIDQAAARSSTPELAPSIQVPAGFRALRVVQGLNYPSSIAWDDTGTLFILESHTVPIPGLKPRILRLAASGELEELETAGTAAPTGAQAIGLRFHQGWLYWSHEEKDGTWGISRVQPAGGAAEAVVRGMPGDGDHAVNHLEFDRAGSLYFGVGSATNSGVVSSHDPVNNKWLKRRPAVRDRACADLTLAGAVFDDENALTDAEGDRAATGAYAAYGSSSRRVATESPCSGSLYRMRPGGSPELLAWGFRNPVALAWDASGGLLIGMHGADIRGTRPVRDDPDAIYRLREGAWYGWPDYSAALLPLTDPRYQPPAQYFARGHSSIGFVIDHAASGLRAPDRALLVAATEPHAALGGMTLVPASGPFARWSGQLLISEMGDFRPHTDPANPEVRAGFQIEILDLGSGRLSTFVRNRGDGDPRPASHLDLEDGLERPVDVKFGPDGLLYILDFGVFEPTKEAAQILPKTGKVFRVEPVPAG
jgi:glucose/arabinose dehydrogenase